MSKPANTPEVNFVEGKLRLSGRSVVANSEAFFNPIIERVKKDAVSANPLKEIEIILDYINSSTVRSLLKMFIQLESLSKVGGNVQIKWFYEEDDEIMFEHGKTFEALVEVPLELVKFNA